MPILSLSYDTWSYIIICIISFQFGSLKLQFFRTVLWGDRSCGTAPWNSQLVQRTSSSKWLISWTAIWSDRPPGQGYIHYSFTLVDRSPFLKGTTLRLSCPYLSWILPKSPYILLNLLSMFLHIFYTKPIPFVWWFWIGPSFIDWKRNIIEGMLIIKVDLM